VGNIELRLKGLPIINMYDKTYAAFYVPKGIQVVQMKPEECNISWVMPSAEQLNEYPYFEPYTNAILSCKPNAVLIGCCKIKDGVNRILYRMNRCDKRGLRLQLAIQWYILDLLKIYGMQLTRKVSEHPDARLLSVRSVTDYIEMNIQHGAITSVSKLAARFFTTRKLLDQQFKEVHNKSVYQFMIERRTEVAVRFLLETRSVQKAAAAMGYEDVFAFSKAFKRWSGRAPSDLWARDMSFMTDKSEAK
jgi:AraC-like DNA-binding protein